MHFLKSYLQGKQLFFIPTHVLDVYACLVMPYGVVRIKLILAWEWCAKGELWAASLFTVGVEI